jgi:tRNA modification GTPase
VGFVDAGGRFDDGLAWLAAAPATVTGEDVAELSFHGNPLIASRLLDALVSAGARLALPGEFTRRAFEAGRVDLLAAEAVQQLVDATTHEGLAIARGAVDGALQAEVAALRQAVVDVTAELEARLDYPEEAVSWAADAALIDALNGAAASARALAASWSAGRAWVEGARVALVGAVNAGKSSLFNALLGRPRALVHATPGTTRDVLEVTTSLDGLAVTLLDTAGERATDDPIEAAGQALAAELVGAADLVIVVLRAGPTPDPVEAELLARTGDRPRVVVYNGVDREGTAPAPPGALATSARTGEGVDALRAAVRSALVGGSVRGAGRMIASARQRDRLLALAGGLEEGARALVEAGEAAAADALVRALGEIDALVGRDTREDVLDALFARFCVGK